MTGVGQELLANVAVIAAVVILWINIRPSVERLGQTTEAVAFGTIMAAGAILSMLFSFQFAPGVIFDDREAPLAMAGFFGGPLAAVIAAAGGLLYRCFVGGDGALAGCLSILLVTATSLLMRRAWRECQPTVSQVVLLATLSAIVSLCANIALPREQILSTLRSIGPATVAFDFVGLVLTGLSVLGEERRKALMRSNSLYKAVIDALPDCLNVKDAQGRFLAANPATAKLMGAESVADLIGRTDFDFYPEPLAREFQDAERAVMGDDRTQTIEQRAWFGRGTDVWLATLKVPFRDGHGRIIGLVTHNRDITALKATELELHHARERLTAAVDNMADGLVMYDQENRIVVSNARYRDLFPVTADLRVNGSRLQTILRAAAQRGEEVLPANIDLETWIETVIARHRVGGERQIALASGRCIEGRTRPTADGGSLTVFTDVTRRVDHEATLRHRAEHDTLTSLLNRAGFEARLVEACGRSATSGIDCAVLLVDLDRFKGVNDTFGHAIGDRLLKEVAHRLEAACRHGDVIARLGGDEFAILCEGLGDDVSVDSLARRVVEVLSIPFQTNDATLLPGGSVGYALHPNVPAEALLACADEALYAAKAAGRRTWRAYSPSMSMVQAVSTL